MAFISAPLRTHLGRNFASVLTLFTAILLIWPTTTYAVGVRGRVSTVSYLYDPVDTNARPDSDANLDLTGRLVLDLQDLGSPAWSAFYMGTANGEVLHGGFSNMKNRVYRGYLQYLPSRQLKVQAGRVWANAGVSSGRVDGARFLLRRPQGTLSFVAGTRGFNDPQGETLHSLNNTGWNQSGWVGGMYRTPELAHALTLNASWARSMWEGREESERVGFTANLRSGRRLGLIYENRYELNQKIAYYQHLRGHYQFPGGSAALAWNRRAGHDPAYDTSYIFRKFRFEPWFHQATDRTVQEVRAHLLLQPADLPGWYASADVVEIYPDGQQNGDGMDLAVGWHQLRMGFRSMRGYRGMQDGFYGNAAVQARDNLRIWLDLNHVSYRYFYEGLPGNEVDRNIVASTVLGADLTLSPDWFLSGSAEFLDYSGVTQDFRARLQIAYRFNVGAAAREVW